jgi:hypothetical protein
MPIDDLAMRAGTCTISLNHRRWGRSLLWCSMIDVTTTWRSGRFSRSVRATRLIAPVVPEPVKNAV